MVAHPILPVDDSMVARSLSFVGLVGHAASVGLVAREPLPLQPLSHTRSQTGIPAMLDAFAAACADIERRAGAASDRVEPLTLYRKTGKPSTLYRKHLKPNPQPTQP